MLLLRCILFVVALVLVARDTQAMVQSIFLVRKIGEDNRHSHMYTFFFGVYCVVRVHVIYWSAIILSTFCLNANYFRQPMDLCMNFAALAFIMEIDDLVVENSTF